jgi:hypothetical protein
MVDKKKLSLARKHLAAENRKFTTDFVAIPRSEWPDSVPQNNWLRIGAFRSRDFIVQVFEVSNGSILSVNRTALKSDGRFVDGISWDELQSIKSAVGFGHVLAIEVYPPDDRVVNVANLRHLYLPCIGQSHIGISNILW